MFRSVAVAWISPGDPTPALALARRLAPGADRLHLLCLVPPPGPGDGPGSWDEWSERAGEVEGALEGWRGDAAAWCPQVTAAIAIDVGPPSLREALDGCGADLVVLGAFPTRRGRLPSLLRECVRHGGPATAWVGRGGGGDGPARHLLCPVGGDARDVGAAAAMLRDVLAPEDRATLLWLGDPDAVLEGDAPVLAAHSGLRAQIAFERLQVPLAELDRVVLRCASEGGADAVALPASLLSGPPAWVVALLGARVLEEASVPLLLLPAPDGHPKPWGRPALLDAADAFPSRRGDVRISVERVGSRGQPDELPDGWVWVTPGGAEPRLARVEAGMARCAVEEGAAPETFALAPVEGGAPAGGPSPLPEAVATLIAPDASRVVLVDALLPEDTLARVRRHPGLFPEGESRRAVAVRSRSGESFHALRARLAQAGYRPPLLLDAHQVLDDAHLADLPPGVEGVLLARVGAHLRADGVTVEALIHGGAPDLSPSGFACLLPGEVLRSGPEPLRARIDSAFTPPPPAGDPGDTSGRLDALTASRALPGNRVEVELDNAAARRRLVSAIEGARERVHLQTYIVMDDPTAGQIEGALAAAAARGVSVRLLVDSLWSLHGSFGVRNPLLDRLAVSPAVEVRAARPLAGVPSLDELKRRDHRKLAVVDGALALVTGRNLSAYNYAGFDEVAIGPDTPAQDVPLLDAGAWIGGPAARAVDETFLAAWTAAGGGPFPLADPQPQGTAAVRIVAHRGMRDAHTLDAYLELFRSARHHLFVVNTFPLHLEIRRGLLAAIRRGVRVRALFGNVRPLRGDGVPFPGGAGALRTVATQLVHARMDALVEAGGEACQAVVTARPGWDPSVREVLPHVHAKVVTCDGERAAIGSANLDVTAGYWESEALAIIEDPPVVAALEADLSALADGGRRVDRDDPAWRALAGRRAWLSSHWPGLIG